MYCVLCVAHLILGAVAYCVLRIAQQICSLILGRAAYCVLRIAYCAASFREQLCIVYCGVKTCCPFPLMCGAHLLVFSSITSALVSDVRDRSAAMQKMAFWTLPLELLDAAVGAD